MAHHTTHIAFLGTGLLGSGMAQGAAQRGDTVRAWNRSPEKAQALAAFGIHAAATPLDAVQGAQRVHLVLKDDAVVDAVIASCLAGLGADAVIIDHSTTLPALTAQRTARLAAQGVQYLHCPVFMGPAAARVAQGSMLVAGSQAVFESVKDGLATMVTRVEYLGERADLAAANKLFGNAMILGVAALMADVLTLAQASNVEPQDAIKLLGMLNLNGMISGRGTNMAQGDFTPAFELTMARKDVGLMVEAAGDRPLAALRSIAQRMDELIAQGHGDKDACVLGIDALKNGH